MDIKVLPGESLTKEQKTEMAKGFEFLGLMAEGGRARKRKGLPLIVPKPEVPKLLRGCGRTPTAADLKELMANVPDEGRLGAFSLRRFGMDFAWFCEFIMVGNPHLW